MKTVAALVMLTLAVPALAQQPSIQNGKVETRKAAALDREIATLAAGATTEPVWVGWRVPVVDGERAGCSTWTDDNFYFRGQVLQPPRVDGADDTAAANRAAIRRDGARGWHRTRGAAPPHQRAPRTDAPHC